MFAKLEKGMREEQKERLLRISEISLWLDTYDDLFSDFDPRVYSERALSEDFLSEIKRASRDKGDLLELRFLIPKSHKNSPHEHKIRRRLREHFRKHFLLHEQEVKSIIHRGIWFVLFGIGLMFFATYLHARVEVQTLWTQFLIVLLEPGGWFLFWEGLSTILFELKTKRSDYVFYKKMINSNIIFNTY